MNGLDYAKCQKSRQKGHGWNYWKNKTKKNSDFLLQKHKIDSEGRDSVLERETAPSL